MSLLAALAFVTVAGPVPQVKYPTRPGDRQFIVDEAGLLKPEDAAEVRRLADDVLTRKRAPIVVVTLKSLADYGAQGWAIERYAMNLMSEWGVGWAEWNHGILLLVSVADRKARIELGGGWGRRKDEDASRIMERVVVPRLREGQFSRGVAEGVKSLHDMALGLGAPPGGGIRDRIPRPTGRSGWLWIILVIVGIVVIGSMLRGGRRFGPAGGYGSGSPGGCGGCSPFGTGCLGGLLGSSLGNMMWGNRGGGWSGGGGGGVWGGGSFGGGSSGGGGATGSW